MSGRVLSAKEIAAKVAEWEFIKRTGGGYSEVRPTEEFLDRIWATLAAYQAAVRVLSNLRRRHLEVEDNWYSCPLSDSGCSDDNAPKGVCTCGADETNAAIDKALSGIPQEDEGLNQGENG